MKKGRKTMITKLTKEILQFELTDGEIVQAMPVKEEADGTVYLFVDCLKDYSAMNATDTTEGGYDASELRKKLNSDILALFPEEVREKMVPVYQDDLLTIPSMKDVFKKSCWEPMKYRRNRIAFQGHNEDLVNWWLRDPFSAQDFAYVTRLGSFSYIGASLRWLRVRPAFKIRNL